MEDLQEAGIKAPDEFELLEKAQSNSDMLLKMINGLVDYLVADVAVPLDEVIDVNDVNDIVSTVLAMREQQGSVSPKVHWLSQPKFRGSNTQMQVVFKNLIENAIKYNENDPEITISHEEDSMSDRVTISNKDNGIGMSEAYLDKIFTPFTRLNTAAEYEGSGLGLSIVRKMVLNHDGDISVESTPGCGSTFYVSLPFKAASSVDP